MHFAGEQLQLWLVRTSNPLSITKPNALLLFPNNLRQVEKPGKQCGIASLGICQ